VPPRLPAPQLKPKVSIGRMSIGYPTSESDYDRRFLVSFADALKVILGQETLR
jgi:hypothetical protein